jgi:hypothetical protein
MLARTRPDDGSAHCTRTFIGVSSVGALQCVSILFEFLHMISLVGLNTNQLTAFLCKLPNCHGQQLDVFFFTHQQQVPLYECPEEAWRKRKHELSDNTPGQCTWRCVESLRPHWVLEPFGFVAQAKVPAHQIRGCARPLGLTAQE